MHLATYEVNDASRGTTPPSHDFSVGITEPWWHSPEIETKYVHTHRQGERLSVWSQLKFLKVLVTFWTVFCFWDLCIRWWKEVSPLLLFLCPFIFSADPTIANYGGGTQQIVPTSIGGLTHGVKLASNRRFTLISDRNSIKLTLMSLDCGRKSEHPGRII